MIFYAVSRKSENNLQTVIAKLQKYSKKHCERTAFTIYNLPQVVEKLFCNSNVGANVVYLRITNADIQSCRIINPTQPQKFHILAV